MKTKKQTTRENKFVDKEGEEDPPQERPAVVSDRVSALLVTSERRTATRAGQIGGLGALTAPWPGFPLLTSASRLHDVCAAHVEKLITLPACLSLLAGLFGVHSMILLFQPAGFKLSQDE